MRTFFILNLFINCCYSFISNAPTPHNSNSKTQKCITMTSVRHPAFSRITSCYLNKNNDGDNEISDLVNKLTLLVLYNFLLFYSIYYMFFEKNILLDQSNSDPFNNLPLYLARIL